MYIDVRTTARMLGISESSVRRLIKAKRLKAVNVGNGEKRKNYRIKKKDLESIQNKD